MGTQKYSTIKPLYICLGLVDANWKQISVHAVVCIKSHILQLPNKSVS